MVQQDVRWQQRLNNLKSAMTIAGSRDASRLSIYHDIEDPELIAHIERVGQIFYS